MDIKLGRRSIRLPGFDYSQAGAYFITICVQDRLCLLGEIVDGMMQPNEAGEMVGRRWEMLLTYFPSLQLDYYVVMPNHFHGIIILPNNRRGAPCVRPESLYTGGDHQDRPYMVAVGAKHVFAHNMGDHQDRRGLGDHQDRRGLGDHQDRRGLGDHQDRPYMVAVGAKHVFAHNMGDHQDRPYAGGDRGSGSFRPRGTATDSVGRIIQAFKSITTVDYIYGVRNNGWPKFPGRLWQRNYYEHVVRNEEALNRIREYIESNPLRWHLDRENPLAQGRDDFDDWLKKFPRSSLSQ